MAEAPGVMHERRLVGTLVKDGRTIGLIKAEIAAALVDAKTAEAQQDYDTAGDAYVVVARLEAELDYVNDYLDHYCPVI